MFIKYRISELKIIFLIFSIPFLMGLGVDLYVPSLPAITEYFSTTSGQVQQTISLYMLGYGIGQFLLGIVSDASGRKIVLRSCSIIFTLSSFACFEFAYSIHVLQFLRLMQGLSVAGLAVVARAMIVDVFDGKNLYKYTNYFGLSWSLGPILGPIIGGYLATYFGWKSNFIFFTIYGLTVTLISLTSFKETNKSIIPYNQAFNIKSISRVILNPIFMGYTLIGGIGYAAIVYFNVIGPFLLQSKFGLTTVQYGYVALLLGAGYFLGSLLNKSTVNKNGSVNNLHFGLLICLASSLLMLSLNLLDNVIIYIIITLIFIIFLGVGFIVPNTLVNSMKVFPAKAGTASSLFGTFTGVIVSIISWYASHSNSMSIFNTAMNYILLITVCILVMWFIQFTLKRDRVHE
ncbi:multidrug effflux MFS transporter [Vibrio sp. MEBiC08052]|uniref:multidrug effflux MFS transporter n=1 Tax=Vibrio sp. MEBiC08052 TaxID=1761910 RepID=UPI0007408033|nr:multidrug effflux MFS transporter [Vibrio sp. MEBiC08052]KUI99677.1 hypothetical protein VRK_11230 [Vibrio sp. MEBiC08052]